jgi:HPt (histidine-containing phosphotransfer) domain-containing protein
MEALGNIIDVNQLRRNTAGDRELLSELITVFQQELPSMQSALLAGLTQQDGTTIGRAAHKLKGSLLVLGARCASTAERLELQAPHGCGATMYDLSAELELKVAQVIPALRTLLQTGEL